MFSEGQEVQDEVTHATSVPKKNKIERNVSRQGTKSEWS